MHGFSQRFQALHQMLFGSILRQRGKTLFHFLTAGKRQLDGPRLRRRCQGVLPRLHPHGILLSCDLIFLDLLIKAVQNGPQIV